MTALGLCISAAATGLCCLLQRRILAAAPAAGAALYGTTLAAALLIVCLPHGQMGFVWALLASASVFSGLLLACTLRIPKTALIPLANASVLPITCGSATYFLYGRAAGHSSLPELRFVAMLPLALWLLGYAAASLAYLWAHAPPAEPKGLSFSLRVAARFLWGIKSRSLTLVSRIALLGVILGVWLVLVAMGILSGFEADLRSKIIGADAHPVLQPKAGLYLPADGYAVPDSPLIVGSAPFIQEELGIVSKIHSSGLRLFAIDPHISAPVLRVLQSIEQGDALALGSCQPSPQAPCTPGIVIGRELATSLQVSLNDTVRLISPRLQILSPLGAVPKSWTFKVVGIFRSGMFEHDSAYAYVHATSGRDFLQLGAQQISGVHIECRSAEDAHAVASALRAQPLNDSLQVLSWRDRNHTLLAALQLERMVTFVVLAFIILVACFAIVNTLLLAIIEKRRDIAILKTLGATSPAIVRIFVWIGVLVGGAGIACGIAFGIVTIHLLASVPLNVPTDVYYLDTLPIALHLSDVFAVALLALLMVLNFSVYPSLRAAYLTPIGGLRAG